MAQTRPIVDPFSGSDPDFRILKRDFPITHLKPHTIPNLRKLIRELWSWNLDNSDISKLYTMLFEHFFYLRNFRSHLTETEISNLHRVILFLYLKMEEVKDTPRSLEAMIRHNKKYWRTPSTQEDLLSYARMYIHRLESM